MAVMDPWITDANVKTRVGAILHISSSNLITLWDTVIADCNQSAHDWIVSKLANRGFTLAQMNSWDRRVEFNRQLALYMSLVNGTTAESYDDKWPEKLKYWMDWLDDVPITIDGVLQNPAAFGPVGHGTLVTTSDEFVKDNSDPQIPHDAVGDPTRW